MAFHHRVARRWLPSLKRGFKRQPGWRFTRLNVEPLEDRRLLAAFTVDTRFDVVDANDGVMSLREAIAAANDEAANPGRDIITFDTSLTYGTVLLGIAGFDASGAIPSNPDLGELAITSDMTIRAGDAEIVRIGREIGSESLLESARLAHRVLRVDSGAVELSNLIIQRGQTPEGEYGAGIWNAGMLTLTNSIVGDNVQRAITSNELPILGGGGGIFNAPTGTLSLVNTAVGSVELDTETLESLGIDPAQFPTGSSGQPLLVPGNVAEGLGGGVFNEGTLALSLGSSVSFNRVLLTGDDVNHAGGIFNAGTLDIVDSAVGNNSAPMVPGTAGGGIHSSTMIPRGDVDLDFEYDFDLAPGPVSVTISNSTIAGNRAGDGGGIYVGAGTSLVATDSTFSQNVADRGSLGDGGAIDNDGTATIVRSTIMQNVAEQNGGGIHSTAALVLESSTISANGVFSGVLTNTGGGVYIAAGSAEIRNSTIAFNQASGAAGGIRNIGTLLLDNSIVSNNTATIHSPDGGNSGTVTATNSLIGNNTSSIGALLPAGNGNLLNVNPLLGPLGDHGGPTFTHGLLAGSPAIDSSYSAAEMAAIEGFPKTDQRGVARLVGPAADRGAFEAEPPASMRVDSLLDEVNGFYGPGDFTLREAVLWAKQIPGPDSIGFSRDLVRLLENQSPQDPLFLELTGGQIVLDTDVAIRGPGADILSIDANSASRIFSISAGANVEISGLTMTAGSVGGGQGGAVFNAGNLIVRDAVVANSVAGSGGGIYSASTGELTLDAVHVAGNTANGGGGVYITGGTIEIVDSTISENTSTSSGGGILAALGTELTAVNSTISSNRANFAGGGIEFDANSTGLFTNVTVTNNFANESENASTTPAGGGIWKLSSSNVTLQNSIVWGNFSKRAAHDVGGSLLAASSFNIIGVGGNLVDGENGNQVGVANALLGPLRNAGGLTPVHSLRPGSPAIDAGNPNSFPLADQRGQTRPVDDPDVEVFGEPQIVRLTDVYAAAINVSSSFPGWPAERALDGDLNTSWFTDNGDAANLGTTPFYEVVFPQDVTVTQINMRGNREFADGYDFLQGRYDLYDAANAVLYSQVVNLPAPNRDFDLDLPDQTGVRRVRFTGLQDDPPDPGFAELEILGPFGAGMLFGPADIGAYEYVPPSLPNPIVVDTLSGISDGIYGPGQVSLGDAIAFANASPTHNEIVFDPALFVINGGAPLDADAVVNLVQALPVTAAASSFFVGNEPKQAIDGDLGTSWFTATNDAANKGKSPWFEVDFGEDVTVTHITMRSNRTNPTGLDFIEGRFDVFDAAGIVLFSQVVTLPDVLLPPDKRDLQLDIPDQAGVRRVRFTSLKDEGATPGFAELEVYGTSGVIGLAGEQLVITDDLTITGPGAGLLSISGNRQNRIFRIEDTGGGPNVTISGVTLTNGRLPRNYGQDANGGAIWNSGDLTLRHVYVANNSIEEYRFNAIAGRGGGIYNEGTLTLENTTLALNSTVNDGGGLYNAGILNSINSTFSTNVAAPTTADSSPSPEGGAIFNAAGATANLSYTTITLNRAVRQDGLGSGIYNAGTLTLDSTIVAENGVGPFFGDDGWTRPGGVSTSLGHNFIGSNQNFNLVATTGDQFGSAGNRLDPLLTDLVSIGGSVPMHGALPSSPVVDAANPASFPVTDQRGMPRPVNAIPDIGAFELEEYAWSSELVVDSFSDALDANYSPGNLTLREAILWANAQDGSAVTDGVDRITFDPAMIQSLANGNFGTNTLVLDGKQLVITDDIVIVDPGSLLAEPLAGAEIFCISADKKSRVLTVEAGASVKIAGLAFADGDPPNSDPFRDGGAILNRGDLTLERVVVENSFADNKGGGIYNDSGILTIERSTIRGNTTNGAGGFGGGGGIHNATGQLHIRASTIADNLAGSTNTNAGSGGGIEHFGTAATISNSAIRNNRAQRDGGGVHVGFASLMSVFNSTISSNETLYASVAGKGGGIFSIGDVELVHVTLAGNVSRGSSGGGGFYIENGTLTVGNTIVATNDQIGSSGVRDEGHVSGGVTFQSLGHNLFGKAISGVAVLPPSDIVTSTPELGPLANNGGPTKTHLLKPTSPAIDAADAMIASAAFPMRLTDQRGRPMVDIPDDKLASDGDFDVPDIGAYEVQGVGSSSWDYQALDRSQFGAGPALVYGFGFDEGVPNSSINPDPFFLGFQFDTGPQKVGGILNGPFGTKFGGELAWDFSGKLGFDLGFYINSGSVDVNYDGNLNYVIDQYATGDKASISTFVDVAGGNLFTVSPKVGAFADLVIQLNADVSATACLFGCVGFDLLDIHFNHTEELFSVNRQLMDDAGRPLFFDVQGNAFARNSANGKFHYPDYSDPSDPNNGEQVSASLQQQLESEGLLPIFDGEIRYFSLGVQDIAAGVVKSKQLKDTVSSLKSAADLYKANSEVTKSTNRLQQHEQELADATARRDNASTAAEVITANREIERLHGRDGNGGEIREARDAQASAKQKQKEAEDTFKKKSSKSAKALKSPKSLVGVSFSEADGSLLGAQANLELGLGVSGADIARRLGTLQVTLPDVNLVDPSADDMGGLHATTASFPKQSDLDFKRQLASAQVDLSAFLPFPTGQYEINLGPISLGVTTVSYFVGPQLNVTQDVSAMPVAKQLTYEFFEKGTDLAAEVLVSVDGVALMDAPGGGADGNPNTVSTASFSPGARVVVETAGTPLAGQAIDVTPTLTMDARFSNDIGLDIDLEGLFEAFAFNLSAFGANIIDIGPLLKHQHTLHTFDIGSVFERTFDLAEQSTTLDTFTLFDQTMDGRTAATAFMAEPTTTANVLSVDIAAAGITPGRAVYVKADLIDPAARDQLYTVLNVEVSGAPVDNLYVLDESLIVTAGPEPGTFEITGFTERMLGERSSALFALAFGSAADATVTTTRSNTSTISSLPSTDADNVGNVSKAAFDRAGVSALFSNDIDGDGIASPLTDGVLLMRHLSGYTGDALVQGAVGRRATRSSPTAIAAYIDDVLAKLIPYTDPDTGTTSLRHTLDFDGNGGVPSATGDGTLLVRYLAGFQDAALTTGVSSADGADVIRFIETGRTSASTIEFDEFGKIIDRRGIDVLGLGGSLLADRSDGSSASAAANPSMLASGASPEFAVAASFATGSALQDFDYFLDKYKQSVMFEEIYLDETLISRVAEGSPLDFGKSAYTDLINAGVTTEQFTSQKGTALLGVEEPIFVKAPDAAGFEYQALDGFGFDSFFIDPQVGGNLLLPSEFDLYLLNDATDQWEYATAISGDNPAQVGVNGFLFHEFAGGPVSKFRLYSRALPNKELHDAENQSPPQLFTTTGFLLSEPPGGAAAPPTVRMIQLAERGLFSAFDPITISAPVFASDLSPVATRFRLVRSGADVIPAINSIQQSAIPLASAVEIRVEGHDNADDTLVLDTSGGPLAAPLVFNGGFRFDTLSVDSAHGEGLTIDLVDRDAISEVELIDIRGSGANGLVMNHAAVVANDPFTQTLRIRGNADDTISIGSGWTIQGSEQIDGISYDRYVQVGATLLIETGSTVVASLLASGQASAEAASGVGAVIVAHGPNTAPASVPLQIASRSPAGAGDTLAQGSSNESPGHGAANESAQIISAQSSLPAIVPGAAVSIDVAYDAVSIDTLETPGLHLRMHYDSSKLTLNSLTNVLPEGFSVGDVQSEPAVGDLDGDPATDAYVNLLWIDVDGGWPGDIPAELFTANFTVDAAFSGVTRINFSGSPAAGFVLIAPTMELAGLPGDYNLDATVDDDDYQLWRSTFGMTVTPGDAADGSRNGVIDAADYVLWRKNLGATLGSTMDSASSSSAQLSTILEGDAPARAIPAARRIDGVDQLDVVTSVAHRREFVNADPHLSRVHFDSGDDTRRGFARRVYFEGIARPAISRPGPLALLEYAKLSVSPARAPTDEDFEFLVRDGRKKDSSVWLDAVDDAFSQCLLSDACTRLGTLIE